VTRFLVDSSVVLDLLNDDPTWAAWSLATLGAASEHGRLTVNPIIYAEIAVNFESIDELEDTLEEFRLDFEELPRSALFLASRAFAAYRRRGGPRSTILPDFFIGAHAAVHGYTLITRDLRRRSHFPRLPIITPRT
jgi:predicted nucleic acid-binding protein